MTPQLNGPTTDRFFHDALAPVRASRLLADWIAEDLKDDEITVPPPVQEHLTDLRDQADFLDSLLRRTALWLGLMPLSPARCNLVEALQDAQADLGGLIVRSKVLAQRCDAPLPHVTLCMRELLGNARQYGAGDCVVRSRQSESGTQVTIETPGPDMTQDDLDRALTPFHSLGLQRTPGLGLPIVAKIAALYDGSLTLTGTGGMSATLRFPTSEG